MPEYYIRAPYAEEARGPYDPDRIADLFSAGKADDDTLYFDEEREEWLPIMDNPEIRAALYPETKQLALRPKEVTDSINRDEGTESVSVDEMLAAAEGSTSETSHLKRKERHARQASGVSLPGLALAFFLLCVSDFGPHLSLISESISEGTYLRLLLEPRLIFGVFDIFLVICCILAASEAFPLIRLRAAFGLGFFGFLIVQTGELPEFAAIVASSIGIFWATLTLNFYCMIIALALAVGGSAAFAFFSIG